MLTYQISQGVVGFLDREGLLVRDENNDYLDLGGLEADAIIQIHRFSITYCNSDGYTTGAKGDFDANHCSYYRLSC